MSTERGAVHNNFAGAAWVFTRSGTTWTQQGPKLVGTGAVGQAFQGTSVALSGDGNTALIGSTGVGVWVFTRSGGIWSQQGSRLVGTGFVSRVGDGGQGDSVALSDDGDTALVGGDGDNHLDGAVWVFTRSGTTWSQQGTVGAAVGTGAVGDEAWARAWRCRPTGTPRSSAAPATTVVRGRRGCSWGVAWSRSSRAGGSQRRRQR